MATLIHSQQTGLSASGTFTPSTAPTAGNMLVLCCNTRGVGGGPTAITGWTRIGNVLTSPGSSVPAREYAMFYRVAQAGDTSWSVAANQTVFNYTEWSGPTALDTYAEDTDTGTTSIDFGGPVTPTAGQDVLILAGITLALENDTATSSVAPGANTTELSDGYGDPGLTFGNNPGYCTAYRQVEAASGSYSLTGTVTHTGVAPENAGITAVFLSPFTEPGVWIDWDQDGFDTATTADTEAPLARMMPEAATAGISDNVTTYTKTFTWQRGGSYDHVGSDGPGGATIYLKNMDGRFDPDNTASPVYGKMVPGLPVWIGAVKTTGAFTGSGTIRGVFGGYVREFNPTVRNGERVCEVLCEDAFGRWGKTPVTIEPSLERSHGGLREAILDAIGETTGFRSLEPEAGMLPISAVDASNALAVLEDLNSATASRHFIAPADNLTTWYTYTVVNKMHALADAASETWNGDDILDVSGWRVTNDNVIEQQRASIDPITIESNNDPVWVYEDVPFTVTGRRARIIYAEFDDYVFEPSIDVNVSSGAVSTELVANGRTAKITIWNGWATSFSSTVSKLQILGRQVIRGDTEQVIAGNTDAGALAGAVITSEYIGSVGAAQGLCDFLVWKFGLALKRPSMTIVGKGTTTLATIFDRDIYDVVTVVIDKLSVTTRRLEIIGLSGSCDLGVGPAKWSVTYELQETPNQSAVDWFTVNTDSVNSSIPIAPF